MIAAWCFEAEPIVCSALIRLNNEVVMAIRPSPNPGVWAGDMNIFFQNITVTLFCFKMKYKLSLLRNQHIYKHYVSMNRSEFLTVLCLKTTPHQDPLWGYINIQPTDNVQSRTNEMECDLSTFWFDMLMRHTAHSFQNSFNLSTSLAAEACEEALAGEAKSNPWHSEIFNETFLWSHSCHDSPSLHDR